MIVLALLALQQSPPPSEPIPYWQQDVRYEIRATLDETRGVLGGTQRITYRNNSPDTLTTFALHLHLNAFRPGSRWADADSVEGIRRFLDRITAIQVTVNLEHRDAPTLELCVDAEHHDDFVATAQADSVLAALDGAIEKIEQQLRKFKERLKERRATSHKHLEPPLEE